MNPDTHDWSRPHYQSSQEGGEPFLFYVIYGAVDLEAPLDAALYRAEEIPDGIDVMHCSADQHASVLDEFREGYLWSELLCTAPDLGREIAAATECVIVRGTPADASNLGYLRDVVGLLTHFLDHGGCCVYDPQMFEWWAPDAWRERIFAPAEPAPQRHVVILTSQEDEWQELNRGSNAPNDAVATGADTGPLTWFHTRGMRKFGRPDLSVHGVPPDLHPAVIELFNRMIEHQARGAVIPEGQPIRMTSLPAGLTCHHAGDLQDPDFNNVHVEIRWGSAEAEAAEEA